MSDLKQDPIKQINAQIEEKMAKAQGLATELQKARGFIQQNEPEFFALQGAIRELQQLKSNLTGKSIKSNQPQQEQK